MYDVEHHIKVSLACALVLCLLLWLVELKGDVIYVQDSQSDFGGSGGCSIVLRGLWVLPQSGQLSKSSYWKALCVQGDEMVEYINSSYSSCFPAVAGKQSRKLIAT